MTSLTLRARGRGAPAEVWDRYADTRRWTQWSPQIRRVQVAEPFIAPGLHGTVIGPLGVAVPFEITDVDILARTWTWRVRLGPIRLRLEHGVEPAGAGSSTWLRVHGPLPVLLGYAPIAQLALLRLVRR